MSIKLATASLLQKVMLVPVPASAAWPMATVTRAVSFTQGCGTATTYVYVPLAPFCGSSAPLNGEPSGASQMPPSCGCPCKLLNNGTAAMEEHRAMLPSAPASALLTTLTLSTALAAGHGAGPATV